MGCINYASLSGICRDSHFITELYCHVFTYVNIIVFILNVPILPVVNDMVVVDFLFSLLAFGTEVLLVEGETHLQESSFCNDIHVIRH